MFRKRNISNDNAITEIVGTMLILGISVSIFSIVYISVLTIPYPPSTPSSDICFSLNETKIVLTHFGGKELDLESDVRIMIGDEPPITLKVSDFLIDEDGDTYWGFGEQFVYNDTTGLVLENSVEVTVIDQYSNSVVAIGRKIITANRAPVMTSPSPSNGTTGVSISIFELNINIFDPNDDTFDWSIETSPNIGSSSGTSESDGVKTCSISGLTEWTTYSWYVNATDSSGSGEWTNNTYTFTTGSETGNNPPSFSNINPVNGASGISVDISSLSLTIEDPEGDLFDWSIETSPDIGSSTGSGEGNGSKSCSVSGLTYSTTYTWFVNATDGNSWTNSIYTFTTGSETGNNPPSFSNINPVNGASGISFDISSLSLTIEDPEGDLFDWSIETSPDSGSSTGSGEGNGSKSCSVSGLTYSTTYTWFVNATDGNSWTNNTYTFTTENEPIWTLLTYDNFEDGWGNYTDGGDDCSLYTDGTYAYENNAADIQDDSNDDSSFYYTSGIDVDSPGYTSIKIDFWFITSGFNNGHSFIIKYWTGSTYVEIERLNYPSDFINNLFYPIIIWINESEYAFPSDMKIRFECDAGNNNDDIYIDEIFVYVK